MVHNQPLVKPFKKKKKVKKEKEKLGVVVHAYVVGPCW